MARILPASVQACQKGGWDAVAKVGIGFQNPLDVQEVFAPLARTTFDIRRCPDFSLEDVFHAGNRQGDSQHVPAGGTIHEIEISGIGLDLDPEIRSGGGDVQAVRESDQLKVRIH